MEKQLKKMVPSAGILFIRGTFINRGSRLFYVPYSSHFKSIIFSKWRLLVSFVRQCWTWITRNQDTPREQKFQTCSNLWPFASDMLQDFKGPKDWRIQRSLHQQCWYRGFLFCGGIPKHFHFQMLTIENPNLKWRIWVYPISHYNPF